MEFEEFKAYFDFVLECIGIAGAIGGAILVTIKRVDILHALWNISRGRADSVDRGIAMEGMAQGGALAQQVLRDMSRVLANSHPQEAMRLEAFRDISREVEPHVRPESPGRMV
jgi:hypothetical protein